MWERFKTGKKIINFSLTGRLVIIIAGFNMLTACINEEINTSQPKTGLEQIQLHNFNAPLSGETLDGSAPDISYFRQKEDGSYVFMLTSNKYDGFETKWETEYLLVTADATGVIQKTEAKKFPIKDGVLGNFKHVFDAGSPSTESPLYPDEFFFRTTAIGPNYLSDDNGVVYYTPDTKCNCRNWFFKLNPESGQTEYFSTGPYRPNAQIFRTSDGGFMTVGGAGAPDYHKFSASGTLLFKQPMRYWESSPAFVYLTGRNGDEYYLTTYGAPGEYGPWFTENTAKSFFTFSRANIYLDRYGYDLDFEIRFGPGKTQKAHRMNRGFTYSFCTSCYEDYVDVPFEVWDNTNNRQLMASFRDQGEDGQFNLVEMKADDCGFPCGANDFLINDPTQSQEWITIINLPYSTTPDAQLISSGIFSRPQITIENYLTQGATWDASALPASSFSLKRGPNPGTQLLKVNGNGSSVVKDNFNLGTVPFQNMYKAVPYLNGSAALINVTAYNPFYGSDQSNVTNPTTQLVILDADFNQTALNMISNPADREYQLEYNKEKDRVFYARITNNPAVNKENNFKGSLLLSIIRDKTTKAEKYLDDFIPFKLEKYRIAPTKTGGVSIVAWVRPTKDTRDLLFFELDENLELVKR